MIETIWSEKIQGIQTLDLSRENRFKDDKKDLILDILKIEKGMKIVDIGCGPGTVTRKIAKWIGKDIEIIGIDRDENFINYAKQKAEKENLKIEYILGDALDIPLENNSIDNILSNTVIEHVPNREFLLEQKRVVKANGRVTIMFGDPKSYIKTEPDLLPKKDNREIELMEKLLNSRDIKKYNVGKYWPSLDELLKLFDELNFKNITLDTISNPIVIDDSRNTMEEKINIIESEKIELFEIIDLHKDNGNLREVEIQELKDLIHKRINSRLELLYKNINIWDLKIENILIASGVVEK